MELNILFANVHSMNRLLIVNFVENVTYMENAQNFKELFALGAMLANIRWIPVKLEFLEKFKISWLSLLQLKIEQVLLDKL